MWDCHILIERRSCNGFDCCVSLRQSFSSNFSRREVLSALTIIRLHYLSWLTVFIFYGVVDWLLDNKASFSGSDERFASSGTHFNGTIRTWAVRALVNATLHLKTYRYYVSRIGVIPRLRQALMEIKRIFYFVLFPRFSVSCSSSPYPEVAEYVFGQDYPATRRNPAVFRSKL